MANPKCTVKARFIGGKVFKPDEESGKYTSLLVLEDGEAEKVRKIRDQAIKEKWAKKPAGLQDWTVREGDDEEYEHSFEKDFVNPKAVRLPKVFTKKKNVLTQVEESDDILYAGCYVFAVIDAFAYDGNKEKKIKPGVTLGLQHLVYWKSGEAIGYDGNPDDSDYEGMETEEDEDDEDDMI